MLKKYGKYTKKSWIYRAGLAGYKDKNGISQICDFIDKLEYLIFSIAKNHFFNDGNKRTSIATGILFLSINGYNEKLDQYIKEMEHYIIELVENKISRDKLKEILKKYIK